MNQEGNAEKGQPSESRAREEDRILARLAVAHKLLSEDQVREALDLQHKQSSLGRHLSLAEILIRAKRLSPRQLDALDRASAFLKMRQPDKAFGKAALQSRIATQEQIDQALRQQAATYKETGRFKRLGDILVEAGVISAGQCSSVLAQLTQAGMGEITGEDEAPPPESAAPEPAPEACREPRETGGPEEDGTVVVDEDYLDAVVSRDRLSLHLRIKGEVPERISGETVSRWLNIKGITFGIAKDAHIEEFLRLSEPRSRSCLIAEGIAPRPGSDAVITYAFATDPRRVGIADTSDRAHFESRGDLPLVKHGDLLAEKTPMVEAVPGTDVYGQALPVEEAKDVRLLWGTGVEVSEDGLRVYAAIDGLPQLTAYGKVSVLPVMTIPGDVSAETGNIVFDGSIVVSGEIKDGFSVKGGSLWVREISRAHVDVAGDVLVFGGILGATIRSQGSVRAVHVHASRIRAAGDVIVDKGVFDSRIVTCGKCIAEKGKILSSSIVAAQGVEAAQIGSDISKPCDLSVGFDQITEEEMERLRQLAASREEAREKVSEVLQQLKTQWEKIELKIGELVQIQDRGALRRKQLAAAREESSQAGETSRVEELETSMGELDGQIRSAGEQIEKLFDQQDHAREKMASCQKNIGRMNDEIREIFAEVEVMAQWQQNRRTVPGVTVYGTIYPGTSIKGPSSSLVVNEKAQRVCFEEAGRDKKIMRERSLA